MKELDPLLHSQLRLAVMSILLSLEEADFVYLKEKTESTAGNLSVQLEKLSSEMDESFFVVFFCKKNILDFVKFNIYNNSVHRRYVVRMRNNRPDKMAG